MVLMLRELARQKSALAKLSVVLFSSACVSTTPTATPNAPMIPPATLDIVVRATDLCEVKVYDEPELSGMYRVGADGTVNFPLIGATTIVGLTTAQASAYLTLSLKRFIKSPTVTVWVKESTAAKIFVFGEVSRPGTFGYEQGITLIHAIGLAGGLGNYADDRNAAITRFDNGKEVRLLVDVRAIRDGKRANVELQAGDIIYVPQTLF